MHVSTLGSATDDTLSELGRAQNLLARNKGTRSKLKNKYNDYPALGPHFAVLR